MMAKLKKVRCPHCGQVNTVDVQKELAKHVQPVLKQLLQADPPTPRSITVTCASCKKAFKIDV
jgi:endogenous inhibitor of DNA gyrase (YacG/DUF329 family)